MQYTNSNAVAVATTSWANALAKYVKANRRPACAKRLALAKYARDSHVVVSYAVLDGIEYRVEISRKWGTVTTPKEGI